MTVLEERLAENPFVSGAAYGVADITALVYVDFAAWIKLFPSENLTNLRRWHEAVSGRPSASA